MFNHCGQHFSLSYINSIGHNQQMARDFASRHIVIGRPRLQTSGWQTATAYGRAVTSVTFVKLTDML